MIFKNTKFFILLLLSVFCISACRNQGSGDFWENSDLIKNSEFGGFGIANGNAVVLRIDNSSTSHIPDWFRHSDVNILYFKLNNPASFSTHLLSMTNNTFAYTGFGGYWPFEIATNLPVFVQVDIARKTDDIINAHVQVSFTAVALCAEEITRHVFIDQDVLFIKRLP